MHHSDPSIDEDPLFWAPGTVILEEGAFLHSLYHLVLWFLCKSQILTVLNRKAGQSTSTPKLHPLPTADPDDPLNWSTRRKTVHFILVNFYVFLTFVELCLGGAAWQAYQQELNFSVAFLNETVAYNYLGLACGCIFLVPFVYKYGRRPIYIFSSVVQLGSCILLALTRNEGDMIAGNLLSGFGGAISEIIAQITIADVFFVHQHAAMNGWFLFAQSTGGTLGPVASGYIVDGQGWRWIWWWCVVLFAINLVLVIFFFEESKYSVATPYQATVRSSEEMATHLAKSGSDAEHCHYNETPKRKSHLRRLTLVKKTDGAIWKDFYRPLVPLFKFAAIAYAAVTFGTLSITFAVITSIMSVYLFEPPYNFSASSVGLMNIALFVTSIPALAFGGYGNDFLILWLSKRNRGIYEPEMRLWLALPMAIVCPAGILMAGLTISYVSEQVCLAM